ncbi:MAG: metallophosphoesterase [Elusimicrobia bacterium]|nr:metallophosphoesterase [Elusimicrobiota bacterium]
MKQHHFFPVFVTLIVSYIGLHFYAARWLAKSFSLSQSSAACLRIAFLLAAFFSPFTMYLKRQFQSPGLEPLYTLGYAWMGVIMAAAFVFACSDLAVLALRRTPGIISPDRLTQLTLAALFFILAWAFYGGFKIPDIKEITVPVKNLPPALEGFKIAQISDTHIDSAWKLRQFAEVVERINAASPDLVLITGDLIDPGLPSPERLGELTAKIKSRLGLFGSLGNHEYYYGLDKAIDCYKAFGIKLLHNDYSDLSAGPFGGKDLRLIGLGDIHNENLSETDVKNMLEKYKTGKFTVVMCHQPLYYELMAETGDYLVLSGHTHKGQIFPFNIFTKAFYRYFYGLYRLKDSVFYVTSGAGTWGPPMRWLAPAEIPVLKLVKQ